MIFPRSFEVVYVDVGLLSKYPVGTFSHVKRNAHLNSSPLMMHGAAPVSAHNARVARTPP